MMNYVLDEAGVPVPEPDLMTWARWFEQAHEDNASRLRVSRTEIADVHVSTVFLGTDHAFMGGPPVLFETMIFGGPYDQWQWRYHTRDEALRGHTAAVEALILDRDPSEALEALGGVG